MIFWVTFPDVYCSLACEKTLKRAHIPCAIDNVPARFGVSCGYAVRCEAPDAAAIEKMLRENSIAYSKLVAVE
jgi:hypothetical protein